MHRLALASAVCLLAAEAPPAARDMPLLNEVVTADARGSVFQVVPTGGDDTASIQAAFDAAVAAGPGQTVGLSAGVFHVSAPIIARGFAGAFVGAGMRDTIVEVAGDPFPIAMVQADPAYPGDPPMPVLGPFTFIEVEGGPPNDLVFADMSLDIKGVTEAYFRHHNPLEITAFLWGIQVVGKRPTVYDGEFSQASFHMDRVVIKGHPGAAIFGAPASINIIAAVSVRGGGERSGQFPRDFAERSMEYIHANAIVTRSHLERAMVGIIVSRTMDSTVIVGGSQSDGNSFASMGEAILIADNSNSRFVFSHNEGTVQLAALINSGNQQLFGLDDEPQPRVPLPGLVQVHITHNSLRLQRLTSFRGSGGVYLADHVFSSLGTKTVDAFIEDNKFDGLVDDALGPTWGAIDVLGGKDLFIANNTITGHYLVGGITAGYCCGTGPRPANDMLILGNDLQTVEAELPIWLGPHTQGNTVVGSSNRVNVLDQGVNTKAGVNNMNGNLPGPEIQELVARRGSGMRIVK